MQSIALRHSPSAATRNRLTNYHHVGLRGSEALVARFGNANGLGFMTNARNGITIIDCDTDDERIFADALLCHGEMPLKVRTASGRSCGGTMGLSLILCVPTVSPKYSAGGDNG
jgi:hypothetical protein